ncbi:hypothetical protein SynWH8103_01272 [Synechococcus sp. WH 8103]|nr:hypothetical protein SynWH8103_01272 [Synechococcus sp. WH 8103]
MRLHSEKDGEQSIRAIGETSRCNRLATANALRSNPEVALEFLQGYS